MKWGSRHPIIMLLSWKCTGRPALTEALQVIYDAMKEEVMTPLLRLVVKSLLTLSSTKRWTRH